MLWSYVILALVPCSECILVTASMQVEAGRGRRGLGARFARAWMSGVVVRGAYMEGIGILGMLVRVQNGPYPSENPF
jgi:hypothetical protein